MHRIALVSVISISLAGCGGIIGDGDSGPAGIAEAQIAQVPAMVGCISIIAAGSRTVTNDFDVTPGDTATLRLKNLPVGNDTFTAFAYAADCKHVGGTQASWASEPAMTAISAGKVASLSLTLRPSGGASVGINFDDDGGTATDGGVGPDGGPSDGGVPSDGGPRPDGGPLDGGVPSDGGPRPDGGPIPADLSGAPTDLGPSVD